MEELKLIAAREAVGLVKDKMVIGLGTGSTVKYVISELGKKELDIVAVPTSSDTEKLARGAGIKLASPNDYKRLDMAIDGADEVDNELNLIKGRGGALTREKIVASLTDNFIVVVDESKLVDRLGAPVAVECLQFGKEQVRTRLEEMGASVVERKFTTDDGNIILDAKFDEIKMDMEEKINNIPGVVENGLFPNSYVNRVYVGTRNGVRLLRCPLK